MQQSTFIFNDLNDDLMLESIPHPTEVVVLPFSDLLHGREGDKGQESKMKETEDILKDVKSLNKDQQHAYDIVDWHLQETRARKKPPQLLMMIPGEGRTGKSRLIQSITENFDQCGVGEWCVKGAYTGIAALVTNGKTLHVLAGIPVRGGKQSAQTLKRL